MKVKCNYCEEIFDEKEIVINDDDDEICPYCHVQGCLMDYPQTVEEFEEIHGHLPEPYGYDMEVDDVEHNVSAFCKKCGAWVGTYQVGYGWTFGSTVDFGNEEKGLCDQCIKEDK